MKNLYSLLLALTMIVLPLLLDAQAGDDRLKELQDASKTEGEGWVAGGAIGLDFAQLALVNPRVGAGDNRIAFGGLGNLYANYTRGKFAWSNNLSLQLAVQKLADIDWQKSLDVLRLNSKVSVQTANEKWAYAALLTFESLALPTYPGNYLKAQADGDMAQAKFLSPFRLEVSPGVEYKPTPHLSFLLSPASYKLIYVADQDIANLGIHGTKLVDDNDPALGYEQAFHQLGARLVGVYTNKYFNDKVAVTSKLDLFSNYLNNPQNIDVLWQNNFDWQIWKSLSLGVLLEAFYDDDIFVLAERPSDAHPDGVLGKRVSWTQALLLKYNYIF